MTSTQTLTSPGPGTATGGARPMPAADRTQIEAARQVIADHYGFWVNDSWSGQLALQLTARTEAAGLPDVGAYLRWINNPVRGQAELVTLVEGLLIGETHFMRTSPHFDALVETILPAWRAARPGNGRLRIASLGCSTGEETYSIAIALHGHLSPEELANLEVTGLDVNGRALVAARAGVYESSQLRELTPLQRNCWFSFRGGDWQIHSTLRSKVRFLQHNLLEPLPFAGLDVIFCRNVLIYFQRPVVASCLHEFQAALRPGGHLILGHSESAFAFPELFTPVQVRDAVIYQNKRSDSFFV